MWNKWLYILFLIFGVLTTGILSGCAYSGDNNIDLSLTTNAKHQLVWTAKGTVNTTITLDPFSAIGWTVDGINSIFGVFVPGGFEGISGPYITGDPLAPDVANDKTIIEISEPVSMHLDKHQIQDNQPNARNDRTI